MTTLETAKKTIETLSELDGPDKDLLTATATAYARGLEQGYRLKEAENGQTNGKSTDSDTGKGLKD